MNSGAIRTLIENGGELPVFSDPRWKLLGKREGKDGRVSSAAYGSTRTDLSFKVVRLRDDLDEWSVYVYDRGDIVDGSVGEIFSESDDQAAYLAMPEVKRMLSEYSTTLYKETFE